MNLIADINTELLTEQEAFQCLTENFEKCKLASPLLKDMELNVFMEAASNILHNLALQASQGKIKNAEDAIDIVTILKVMQNPEYREALEDSINQKQFSVVVRHLGDDQRVVSFLKKQARHPSIQSIKGRVTKAFNSVEEPEHAKQVAHFLQKMRMDYEKIQLKLQQQGPTKNG